MISEKQCRKIHQRGRDYLKNGLCLVPINEGQKRPMGSAWNDADNVITDASDWFKDVGGCGLAHVQSRTAVLDIDDYMAATEWLSEHGIDLSVLLMADNAVQIQSGRKNRAKLLFRLPDGIEPLITQQPEGSGLELRCAASNGKTMQDLLPPSIHPDTGKAYRWRGDWKNPPGLPSNVLELWQSLRSSSVTTPDLGDNEYLKALADKELLTGAVHGKSGAHAITCPWAVKHSNGDGAAMYFEPHTNGYAGHGFKCLHAHCADRGIDDLAKFLGMSSMATLTLGGEPIGERAQSSQSSCVADPPPSSEDAHEPLPLLRDVAEGAPFPLSALGPVLEPVARHIVASLHAPGGLCGQSVLAAASLAAQAHADVVIDHIRSPLSLSMCSVGESGERKTSVDSIALYPIRQHEKLMHDSYDDEHAAYELDFGAWESVKKSALTAAADGDRAEADRLMASAGREPLPPPTPELVVSDPTAQGLTKHLAKGWPSVGLFSDEGAVFLGGWSMKPENMAATAGVLSKLWDGAPISRTRAGECMPKLYGRRVALHLMVQPSVAPMLLGNATLHGQGLLSRILPSWPASTIGARPYTSDELYQAPQVIAYTAAVCRLLSLEPRWDENLPNTLDPRSITVKGAAHTALAGYYWEVEQQLGEGKPLALVRDLGSKALAHCCRIAAVLTLLEDPDAFEVTVESAERSVVLVQYYLGESLRLAAYGAQNPDLMLAQKLLAWAREQGGSVHARQIYQYGPYGIRDRATALRIAELLETHGWFIRLPGGTKVDGTSRQLAWTVRT